MVFHIYSIAFSIIFQNSQCDQLSDGLIHVHVAHLVESCTSIAEVMGLNPVQAGIFSGFNFTTA